MKKPNSPLPTPHSPLPIRLLTGFGIAATLLSLLPIGDKPAIARVFDAGTAIAENVLQQPKINLNLVADKQQIQKDVQGKESVTWKALDSKGLVKPGEVIRFTLTGKNEGNRAAKNLEFTQRVTQGTVYQLNSATPIDGASLTYSIDQGKTFIAKPTIKVTINGKVEERPAPAEAYTHLRWTFNQPLQPNTSVKVAYLTKVR